MYIIRATINSISHLLCWAQSSASKEAGVWRCPLESAPITDMNINLLRKPRVKRNDLIYQFLGNALWKEGRQRQRHPTSACEPGGTGRGALGTWGAGKGSTGPKGPWVRAPSRGNSEKPSSPQVLGGNPSVIAKVQAEGGVSGGAGARRLHACGCARSQLCRRSGRNRSCSRSARSCIVSRAGSALGTHRCLEVRVTSEDFTRAPELCYPLVSGPSRASAGPNPAPPRPLALWPRPLGAAHRRSARGTSPAGSRRDTRTLRRPAAAHSGRSRSDTRPNPPPSCPLLRGRRE